MAHLALHTLHTPQEAAAWLRGRVQGVLHTDSRRVQAGDGFIAWPGGVRDGRAFVHDVLQQQANAVLVEREGVAAFDWSHAQDATVDNNALTIASYEGLKAASGPIAAAYYEQPSRAMDVVAITGTNGKTSTAWWLAHALNALGQRCAVVGTLGVGEVHALEVTGMTTPDPVLLQARLRDMVNHGVTACAIEASSIGIAEHRLDGTHIKVAVFTNFTQDHLDYHGSMQSYWQAKATLFDWPELSAAVVQVDDDKGRLLAQQLSARSGLQVWTFACHEDAPEGCDTSRHLRATDIVHGEQGLQFAVACGASSQTQAMQTRLVGTYNVSNVLGVMTVLCAMGHPLSTATQACRDLPAVPGRMQTLGGSDVPLVVIDYAHTPDAVAQAVQALLPLAQTRGGQVTCVLGCGGDRDASKRPLMAAMAEQHAHQVVLTSDNPRSENPDSILQQMLQGVKEAAAIRVLPDRAQAIAWTVQNASAQDVVLIAGKGHEDYQEIAGVRRPFSDAEHARLALQHRRAHV
jgi:UDP-N-acetylmuramoyl-L-alanyl-D-glutamate--2,6-diaminopimelate ligase